MEQAGAARRLFDLSGQQFDLSGGALCLDFANTLDDRPDPRPNEYVASYADLLAFAQQTGALVNDSLACLLVESNIRPADAADALARAIDLREVIYRLYLALAEDRPAAPADLADLNRALGDALAHARITEVPAQARFVWTWADEPLDLTMPLWPIARSAADLLASSELAALRLCASETCAWLFLDTSRNGSRRWCSMRTCGNRAKARRHHARVRAASAAAATES